MLLDDVSDDQASAVGRVHEPKKTFYRKFLYEPFPVESCLQEQLHDHFNAEVVGGTITSRQDAVDFLSWTYFYRRLTRNPAYYHLDDNSSEAVVSAQEMKPTSLTWPKARGRSSPSHAEAPLCV